MPIDSHNPGPTYGMQGGLWGLTIMETNTYNVAGEDEQRWECVPMPSILPMMKQAADSIWSEKTVGGRCSLLRSIRLGMAESARLTGSSARAALPSHLMISANSQQANESSQRTLAGLLAMQLIGAGYRVRSKAAPCMDEPAGKPLIGTPNRFQGYKGVRVLLSGLDTRPKSVQKTINFMESVRSLAREYLTTHKMLFGSAENMGYSDQLAHRARLTVLAANPEKLKQNSDLVKNLFEKLNIYERMGIGNDGPTKERHYFLVGEVANLVNNADQHLFP